MAFIQFNTHSYNTRETFKYMCGKCDKEFNSIILLKSHEASEHIAHNFKRRNTLPTDGRKHYYVNNNINNKNTGNFVNKLPKCKLCDRIYSSTASINRHNRSEHHNSLILLSLIDGNWG